MATSTLHTGQPEYKLVGAELSMYTGKVRAYMRWKGIPFKEVIASSNVHTSILLPHTTVAFMPTLLINHPSSPTSTLPSNPTQIQQAIQDTKDIIDYFETHSPNPSLPSNMLAPNTPMTHPTIPASPLRAFASMFIELLADEWLAVQGMFWRWGDGSWRQESFAEQMAFLEWEFGNMYTAGRRGMGVEETRAVGREACSFFKTVGSTHLGITPTTGPTFRQNFDTLLTLLTTHLTHHPFLLGAHISLADFAFYGTFYGHLSRDPIPSSVIKTRAPLVWEWVERVSGLGRFAGMGVERWEEGRGEFVGDYGGGDEGGADAVPETMTAVARLLVLDYLPILASTVEHTIAYLDGQQQGNAGDEPIPLPRFLAHAPFTITASAAPDAQKVEGSHAESTHAVWMLQRIIDRTYRSDGQRQAADDWMREVGGMEMVGKWQDVVGEWEGSGWRVGRRENKIVGFKVGGRGYEEDF